jgi:hypothetical protein
MAIEGFISQCWPDDPDYLDGVVELSVPPSTALEAYWDADIVDQNGVDPGTIIKVTDPFLVRFRVELRGDLWHCIHGDWCFDLKFTTIGEGPNFDLSKKLDPGVLDKTGWNGCKAEDRCIEVKYTVPAGTVPGDLCGSLYEVGATFALRCCEDERPILVGFEAIEEREFY